jgi:aminoglycoside phosphotransferase (APT) family kinase protein
MVSSPSAPAPGTRALAERLAVLLRLDPASLAPLGGASGEVFAAGDVVLRLGSKERLDVEVAAMGAAADVTPVPDVLDRVDDPDGSALVLRRMAGAVAIDLQHDPERARRRGAACGAAQLALTGVVAPAGLPLLPDAAPPGRLLHLDLHPLNVLLDDDDRVTAVLDWADTASGPPASDLARTWAMLHLDPAADPVREHPAWVAFVDGWSQAAGLAALAPAERAWGCRYLLGNLAGRYTGDELLPARRMLTLLEA